MNQPTTIYDVLEMLATYHKQRAKKYEQLGSTSTDPRAKILLEHLVELENNSYNVTHSEIKNLASEHSTYLITGPAISADALHAAECRFDGQVSFGDTLNCAFASAQLLNEMFDRIEDSSAASSVTELANRLRDLEGTKSKQIANFTRRD